MKVAMLMHPVEDLDTAVRFYREALGLPMKFRDGDRFCALDAGSFTLALAGAGERIVGTPALAWRVDGIDAEVARLVAAGAQIVSPVELGPHERRAVLRDPAGQPLILTERNKP